MTTNKNARGWPKGRAKPSGYTRTHHHGDWAWNNPLLMSKAEPGLQEDDCWQWRGAQGPMGNLFGAYKNGRPQMTQANRLIARQHGHEIDNLAVFMRCHNKFCCNPLHMVTAPAKGTKRGLVA